MDFKTIALITAIVLAATTIDTVSQKNSEFESFKLKFGKKYATETEEIYRLAVYENNKKWAEEINAS